MSMLLMAKAMSINVGSSARKFVLLKLADNANDKGECFPSYQHIADHCEISRKSAINHIKALCDQGLVRKVYRKGEKGNSSNIYIINLSGEMSSPDREMSSPDREMSSPDREMSSPPPSENISPRTSHSFEPVNEPIIESISKNSKIKKDLDLSEFKQRPTEKVWSDYLEHRKNKRAKLTQTALDILIKQINICIDSGYSTDEILAEIMMRGWQGFKAEWIIKPDKPDKPKKQNQSPGQSFKNTNYGETKQPKWAD